VAEIHKIHGLKELEDNLLLLGRDVHQKGVRRMMSRAAVPMRDDARVRAPILKTPDKRRTSGLLKRMIVIWRQRKTPYAATYYVGVRKGSRRGKIKNPLMDAFYWLWQELGTSKHPPANGTGFLRPAFESKKHTSVKVAMKEGQDFIRRTAARFKRTRK
jgi:HK97 gp10 family phage protein